MKIGINKETAGSVAAIVLVAIGGWYFYSWHLASGKGGNTVALVNGEKITRSELASAESQMSAGQPVATSTGAKAALDSQALDSLVSRALLLQAATAAGFTASSTAVDAQIQADQAQLGGADAFAKALTTQGVTEEDLRTKVGENLAIQAYLEQTLGLSSLTATEAEIKTAYDQAASAQSGLPPLAQIHDQVKQFVIGQKQQALVTAEVDKLRAAGKVQTFI